jgi:hypothetical protein
METAAAYLPKIELWVYLILAVFFLTMHVYTYPSSIDFFSNPDSKKNNSYPVE